MKVTTTSSLCRLLEDLEGVHYTTPLAARAKNRVLQDLTAALTAKDGSPSKKKVLLALAAADNLLTLEIMDSSPLRSTSRLRDLRERTRLARDRVLKVQPPALVV